jgi:hypothetical protein
VPWAYALDIVVIAGRELLDCAPHDLLADRGQIATPEHGRPTKPADWPFWKIVALMPHMWRIFGVPVLTALIW